MTIDGVEYFGGVGYLKAGLLLSDRITTVSPTYAREIMTPAFGMALDGLLRTRAAVVQGIVNGIDDTVWNPATDPALAQTYSALRIDMRVRNKTALQTRLGLAPGANRPLFGVISRLSDQKGLDLLLEALPDLIGKGGQFALLGSGDPALEAGFVAAAAARPELVGLRYRIRREARPSLPGRRRLHRRAVAVRALRPDPALRSPLWRGADRRSRRRPRRHRDRRQRGGRSRREWRPASSSFRPRSKRSLMRSTGRWRSAAILRDRGASSSTACARTSPGAARRSDTPRFIALSPGLPNERHSSGPRRRRWREGARGRARPAQRRKRVAVPLRRRSRGLSRAHGP